MRADERAKLAPLSPFVSASFFLATTVAIVSAPSTAEAAPPVTVFESGHVRPLALSPDGKRLFAVNTPDNRLEIFDVYKKALKHVGSVPVGLEPVAVAARSNSEVWVVNHLSDSVSVVKIPKPEDAYVSRTLLVGDEPRDIVFAGPGRVRAFITTAHRGQNSPIDPQVTTPGVGRADVWVFNGNNLGDPLGGSPLTILTLFSDTPRALAVTPDGKRVYAAAFHSGNKTTSISETLVPDGGEEHGGVPEPRTNFEGIPQPEVGLIVKHNGEHWVDELGRDWDAKVPFSLPDKDVFVLDAMASPPAQLQGSSGFFTGVGTILFNMAVNPVNGKVYVSNTEAFNEVRFEGPGVHAGSSVRGHLHESRITVLSPSGVKPRHLNKHIDYSQAGAPIPNNTNRKSLAFPQDMAITSDGKTLYVAALGSSKVGVFSTAALEQDTFVPNESSQIKVTGGGPTGLALDENRDQLYVLTRFDNSISVISTKTRAELAHVAMHSPEPPSVIAGRRVLYDASMSSSHGDSACASCHVYGDFDSLAWDLGNPDASALENRNPFIVASPDPTLFPMKGPMATQSLRGMANHGPMHWRGDRTGGNDEPSFQPDAGAFREDLAFKAFRGAFVDLLGRHQPIPDADMQAFADFILQVTYPPNPLRNLDNSLTPDQQIGKAFFEGPISDPELQPCNGCHVLNPNGNPGSDRPGFFGSDGSSTVAPQTQPFKVPHLRNQYQKVGMFGMGSENLFLSDGASQGDQVRGFGYLHDGSVDTVFRFLSIIGFTAPLAPEGFPSGAEGEELKRQVESYLLAFDSNMAPVVGQQATLRSDNDAAVSHRIDLLMERAEAGECDLVAKRRAFNKNYGYLYVGGGSFLVDREGSQGVSDNYLRAVASSLSPVTYTCVPPGSGARMALDRDSDGHLDGDEEKYGSDPADPESVPSPGCGH